VNDIDSSGNKSFYWTDASTRLFLHLYRTKREMVYDRKIKNLRIMWQLISQELKEVGYIVTPLQVENKFKTLERAYKNMMSNNKRTGRRRIECSYETYV